MIKVSELTGKPIISLADAKNLGCISAIWFDGKLCCAKTVEIVNDEDDSPEKMYVPLKDISVISDAAVVRSNVVVREKNLSAATVPCPINSICYNQDGKSFGYVCDVSIEGDNVTEIVCDAATFAPDKLIALGNNLCLVNDTDKPIKLPKPSRTKKKKSATTEVAATKNRTPETAQTATVAQAAEPLKNHIEVQIPSTPQSVTVTRTPGDAVKDYSFLMGKPVHAAVVSQGRILIPSGTVVDEQVIEYARRENKLVQLALQAY